MAFTPKSYTNWPNPAESSRWRAEEATDLEDRIAADSSAQWEAIDSIEPGGLSGNLDGGTASSINVFLGIDGGPA